MEIHAEDVWYENDSQDTIYHWHQSETRADQEKARADQEKARADQEKTRADKLAKELKQLKNQI